MQTGRGWTPYVRSIHLSSGGRRNGTGGPTDLVFRNLCVCLPEAFSKLFLELRELLLCASGHVSGAQLQGDGRMGNCLRPWWGSVPPPGSP